MGEQEESSHQQNCSNEDRQEQQQQRPAFSSNRRTGSSWNRGGNSSWPVGGKDQWKTRRRGGGPAPSSLAADGDSGRGLARGFEKGDQKNNMASLFKPQPKVNVQKGSKNFQVEGSVVTEADPDSLYSIITDYDSNARVFRSVDRVEVEDRGDEKVVTQHVHWNFLMWSGNYNVRVRMKPNPETRSMSYNLDKPGFLQVFHGSWTVEPLPVEGEPTTSKLVVQQEVLPSFIPPGPLGPGAGSYASRIMSNQVKNLLTDVAKEASEVAKTVAAAASASA